MMLHLAVALPDPEPEQVLAARVIQSTIKDLARDCVCGQWVNSERRKVCWRCRQIDALDDDDVLALWYDAWGLSSEAEAYVRGIVERCIADAGVARALKARWDAEDALPRDDADTDTATDTAMDEAANSTADNRVLAVSGAA